MGVGVKVGVNVGVSVGSGVVVGGGVFISSVMTTSVGAGVVWQPLKKVKSAVNKRKYCLGVIFMSIFLFLGGVKKVSALMIIVGSSSAIAHILPLFSN